MKCLSECFIPVYNIEDTEKETPFAEISFNAQLVSSNNNGRVTPLEVCELGMLFVQFMSLSNTFVFSKNS